MNNSLDRFLIAQEHSYDTALREIRAGRKRSHWMWYIFPQIAGLGMSYTAQLYSIADIDEARRYIGHPVLGERLIEISRALLTLESSDAGAVMGYPDDRGPRQRRPAQDNRGRGSDGALSGAGCGHCRGG